MYRSQLRRRISERKQFMLNEGLLNDKLILLEELQVNKTDFVEIIIVDFIPVTTDYIRELERILETVPLNLAEMESLIMELKAASFCLGAVQLFRAIEEMLAIFNRCTTDTIRLGAALRNVKSQHATLKMYLQPYVEMLILLRIKSRDHGAESVGSNDESPY